MALYKHREPLRLLAKKYIYLTCIKIIFNFFGGKFRNTWFRQISIIGATSFAIIK